jgi:hypothetical protein
MNDAQFTLLMLGLAFISLLLAANNVRRRRIPLDLRPITSYRALPLLVDEAVESNRTPHFSLGTAAVGQSSTVAALAAAAAIYPLLTRLSFERRLPLVTLADPLTLALGSDTLRKAYLMRGNVAAYRPGAVVWYPSGEKSLSFAAGAANHAQDSGASSHILLGQIGPELALLTEAAHRKRQKVAAYSIGLEGQAIAYASADHALLGEELFVAPAYLEGNQALQVGSAVALDVLRWFVIVIIIVALVVNGIN